MKNKPLIMIGGGGHASVLVDILRSQNRDILAVVTPTEVENIIFSGIKHIPDDSDVLIYSPDNVLLVNGIGMMPNSYTRKKVNEYYLSLGFKFESVISNSAIVSAYAEISSGVQILHGAVIQTGAKVGSHSIINSRVVIEHDTEVGTYNHIAPGAVLCGSVKTSENVFVGAGATVIQNVVLHDGVFIAAGATVTRSLSQNSICYPGRATIIKGVP
ncbi:acetyltransferase [Shewanella basaltis]|uniref:acetyltransferase n=1 Tax=Shewanella basaltis TaxID=472183 RepID=UPI003AB06D0B